MSRSCPVCQSDVSKAQTFVEENIDLTKYSGYSFSSRKRPEYMCHHMARCSICDVVYTDNPPREGELCEAYHRASYDSAGEAKDAADAYIKAIAPVLHNLKTKETALEIGTGVFLLGLKKLGFDSLIGVEPSTSAIQAAPIACADWIQEGMFNPDDFEHNSFDLVCCFMTMEHVLDPAWIMSSVMKLLRPGGAFVTVTHDYRSPINRMLGKRSPIIDIEHLQIFSAQSIKELFLRGGYSDIYVASFKNTYSLKYWLRLCPIPEFAKRMLEHPKLSKPLNSIKLSFNVGNTLAAGYKPKCN